MISLDEIKKLGLLSRIKIGSHEAQELQKGLDAILGYVSKLGKAPVKEVKISEAPTPPHQNLWCGGKISNVFRKDEPTKDESEVKKGAHIRVKRIL